MVPPAPDARAFGPIAAHSNRVSADCGLRCREMGFPGQRKIRQYVARTTDLRSQRPSGRTRTPPVRGLSQPLQEISASAGMRGGPGRTRTSNQTVMSAVTSSEMPINSDVSRHVNQRMFTIGCGQPLAKRWLDHEQCACARFGVLMDGGEVTGMRVGSR